MQQGPGTLEQTLRFVRIVHGTLMVAIVIYFYVLRVVPQQPSQPLDPFLPRLFGIVAAIEIGIALFVRIKKLGAAFESLRNDPADTKALIQWRQAVVISDALALSVALYGLAFYSLGGTNGQVIPFFVAGAVLMIFWWPRRP